MLEMLNNAVIVSVYSLNLYELIKKNNYQGFSLSLIRRFAHSLVQCLRLLHKENIIHCDLKPVSLKCVQTIKILLFSVEFNKGNCSYCSRT